MKEEAGETDPPVMKEEPTTGTSIRNMVKEVDMIRIRCTIREDKTIPTGWIVKEENPVPKEETKTMREMNE